MTRASHDFERSPFRVDVTLRVDGALQRETELWELAHPGERSQLPEELVAAKEVLAVHPYVGRRVSGRPPSDRKLQLPRTGLFILYRIHPRLRTIRILSLAPRASLAHRR